MKRIQRRRTKGWRMPEGAVYVGRPSRWGNPYSVGDPDPEWCGQSIALTTRGIEARPLDAQGTTYHFRLYAIDRLGREPDWLEPLRGRDLACWCPLTDDQGNRVPCHADVLLDLANR